MNIYSENFTVRQYETGRDYCLRLANICNYMEDVASTHAEILGAGMDALSAYGLSWAMTKMRLQVMRLPRGGEKTQIATWPSVQDRFTYRRDFSYINAETNELLVAGVTQWVVFDLVARKASKLPESIVIPVILNDNLTYVIDGEIKIPPVKEGKRGPDFSIRLSDIDRNNHVNNVRYVDFLLEAATAYASGKQSLLHFDKTISQLDITFRTEALIGETITAYTAQRDEAPLTLTHSLKRGDTEIVRGKTVWKESL